MELCRHISHHHQNTSICSLEDINQTNNACLNTQKERKTEWAALGSSDPGMYFYLCLKSAYSSWFGKPSQHILIPSKTPLQRSCCRSKEGTNKPVEKGSLSVCVQKNYYPRSCLNCCILGF